MADESEHAKEEQWKRDVWEFIRKAVNHWKELIGGSLIAAVVATVGSIGFNFPPVLSGIGAFSFAVILACFLVWRDEKRGKETAEQRIMELEEQSRPGFTIECDSQNNSKCAKETFWANNYAVKFYRALIDVKGNLPIPGCCGFLCRIEKDGKIKWENEDIPLTFSPGEAEDALNKTITKDQKAPLDVLAMDKGGNIFICQKDRSHWPYPQSLQSIFSEEGNYVLTIRVSSNGITSLREKLIFYRSKDWETSFLKSEG
jgi:hypothetical protein